jgi:hypothetical protein
MSAGIWIFRLEIKIAKFLHLPVSAPGQQQTGNNHQVGKSNRYSGQDGECAGHLYFGSICSRGGQSITRLWYRGAQCAASNSIRTGTDRCSSGWIRTAILFAGGRMNETGMRIFFGLLNPIYTYRN